MVFPTRFISKIEKRYTFSIVVYVGHQIVKEGKNFNLCKLLLMQLIENITMTKENGYPFCFGSLITCLMLYFLRSLPLKENFAWKSNIPVGKHIYRYLSCLVEKDKACKDNFIDLQNMWCSSLILGIVSCSFPSKIEEDEEKWWEEINY